MLLLLVVWFISINAQITDISPQYNTICISGSLISSQIDGKYTWHSFNANLNASTYYNNEKNQYLHPSIDSVNNYQYVISNNPINTNSSSSICYIINNPPPDNFFSLDECFENWISKVNNTWITDTNMILINCDDICISGTFNRWYTWSYFNYTTNSSVYLSHISPRKYQLHTLSPSTNSSIYIKCTNKYCPPHPSSEKYQLPTPSPSTYTMLSYIGQMFILDNETWNNYSMAWKVNNELITEQTDCYWQRYHGYEFDLCLLWKLKPFNGPLFGVQMDKCIDIISNSLRLPRSQAITSCGIELYLSYNEENSSLYNYDHYALAMENAIYSTFSLFTGHSMVYYAYDEYLNRPWRFGGITNYQTCMIFNKIVSTIPNCPTIPNPQPVNSDFEFVIAVLFCVEADQNADLFLQYLLDIVSFENLFHAVFLFEHSEITNRGHQGGGDDGFMVPTTPTITYPTDEPTNGGGCPWCYIRPPTTPTTKAPTVPITADPSTNPTAPTPPTTAIPSLEPTPSPTGIYRYKSMIVHDLYQLNQTCWSYMDDLRLSEKYMYRALFSMYVHVTGHSMNYNDGDEYFNQSWRYGGIVDYEYFGKLSSTGSGIEQRSIQQISLLNVAADQNEAVFAQYIVGKYSDEILQFYLDDIILLNHNMSCYLTSFIHTPYDVNMVTTQTATLPRHHVPRHYPTTNYVSTLSSQAVMTRIEDAVALDIWSSWHFIVIIACCGFAICLFFIMIALCYYRRNMSVPSEQCVISNALAVAITICDYENISDNADIKGGYLMSLPMEKDIENLKELFDFLYYKLIPCEYKTHWKEDELMYFLQNDVCNELIDKHEGLKYDALIVCISCHGIENKIVTSDYRTIEKTVIHRIISNQYPEIRDIPRIFLFDSCEGSGKREYVEYEDEETGKGTKLKDISNGLEWTNHNKNPDYNLVQINAANAGFQAKYNTKTGSYLIERFTNKVKENIIKKTNKTLAVLCEEIESELHDKGKQLITNTFHNNTGHLRFKINDGKHLKKLSSIQSGTRSDGYLSINKMDIMEDEGSLNQRDNVALKQQSTSIEMMEHIDSMNSEKV